MDIIYLTQRYFSGRLLPSCRCYLRMYVMGEEPGAVLSASLVFLLSMISISLTICNALLKTLARGVLTLLGPPFQPLLLEAFSIPVMLKKTLLHKSSEWSKVVVFGPGLKFPHLETKNTGNVHSSQP